MKTRAKMHVDFLHHRIKAWAQCTFHVASMSVCEIVFRLVDLLIEEKAETEALRNLLPHIDQNAVSGELIWPAVEIDLGTDLVEQALAAHGIDKNIVSKGEYVAVMLVPVLPAQRESVLFKDATDRIGLLEEAEVDIRDMGLGIGLLNEETFLDEFADRFSKWAAADFELLCQPRLYDLAAGLQSAGEYGAAQFL